jgi:hypothetical protein
VLDEVRNVTRIPFVNAVLGGWNVGLEKTIALSTRVRFDVRAEAYNLLNRRNFNLPGSTLGAADFGSISSARAARTVQPGARLQF